MSEERLKEFFYLAGNALNNLTVIDMLIKEEYHNDRVCHR